MKSEKTEVKGGDSNNLQSSSRFFQMWLYLRKLETNRNGDLLTNAKVINVLLLKVFSREINFTNFFINVKIDMKDLIPF